MIEIIFEHVIRFVDIVGAAILVFGLFEVLFLVIRARLKSSDFLAEVAAIRCRLGSYLLLGLEFLIVSDILETIVEPTRDELISIALLVVIRTAIGYFLGKELAELESSSS